MKKGKGPMDHSIHRPLLIHSISCLLISKGLLLLIRDSVPLQQKDLFRSQFLAQWPVFQFTKVSVKICRKPAMQPITTAINVKVTTIRHLPHISSLNLWYLKFKLYLSLVPPFTGLSSSEIQSIVVKSSKFWVSGIVTNRSSPVSSFLTGLYCPDITSGSLTTELSQKSQFFSNRAKTDNCTKTVPNNVQLR